MDLGLRNKLIVLALSGRSAVSTLLQVLNEEGAVVVVVGSTMRPGQTNNYFIETDLNDPASCEKTIEIIFKKYGRIEGLINYTGLDDVSTQEASKEPNFSTSLQKELSKVFLITHYALPYLKLSKVAIINVRCLPNGSERNRQIRDAVSGGIDALTREWAVELLTYQIRVNSLIKQVDTAEVGEATAFLMSEKSSHTTGQLIHIGIE